MSHFVEGNYKTFQVGATDIPAGSAVKFGTSADAGKLVVAAAATDKILGVINSIGRAGTLMDVHLRSAAGTICMKVGAGGAVAVGDRVTADASGLGVTTTTTGNEIIGMAVEAAAVGKFVEMLPSVGRLA